jgi:uncharacterized protein (DUF1697 family)
MTGCNSKGEFQDMTTHIAFLRAVNVGGTRKLPMAELRALVEAAGFTHVRTYIASGNLLFESPLREADIKTALAARLSDYMGQPVGVIVRTARELADVRAANPFPEALPARTVAIFLDAPPPADALARMSGRVDEQAALGVREIYVHYPSGMGQSKLRITAGLAGTARNMNTIAKLAGLSASMVEP